MLVTLNTCKICCTS